MAGDDEETVKPQDQSLVFSMLETLDDVLVIVLLFVVLLYVKKEKPPSLINLFKFLGILVGVLFIQFYILKLDMFKVIPSSAAYMLVGKVFNVLMVT